MMSLHAHSAFAARGRALEEAYFRTKDAELVEKLQRIFHDKLDKDELRRATGITDEVVLDRLIAANVRGELLTVFRLYPLVEIAWANGRVNRQEAAAVIEAAVKLGLPPESESFTRLGVWLAEGPTSEGRAAWRMFARELRRLLTPQELDEFRHDLLRYARDVADASSGILGRLIPSHPREDHVIAEIKAALTHD